MNHSRSAGRAGFTLPEVLITTGISVVVLGACLTFFITALNIFHYDIGKNRVNRDIRAFTSELTDNATYANYFQIYPNFTTRSTTVSGVTVSADVEDKQTGDMLVLIFKDPTNVDLVSRVVGYYRAPSDPSKPDSTGPVRKFDRTISPSSAAPIHTLLPATSTYATNPEVLELSRGLANGRLFYNVRNKSIMINGEILHRGGTQAAYKYATNTYNFTVSPRG